MNTGAIVVKYSGLLGLLVNGIRVPGIILAVGIAVSLWQSIVATAGVPEALSSRRCAFLEGTLIPQVVIGVRRVGDPVEGKESVDYLEIYPAASGEEATAKKAKLFRPYFVSQDGDRDGRVLIQEDYFGVPLGWVSKKNLHFLESRYAYVFSQGGHGDKAELHDRSREAYERHLAQLEGPEDRKTAETVVLKKRAGAEPWLPVSREDKVPFVELLKQSQDASRDEPNYPDTTPTFGYGFPQENRLLHLGAVCGGPVAIEKLEDEKKKVKEAAGVEMLFVIDETSSMKPFFGGVADFIEGVANLAAGRMAVRAGVVYYADGAMKKDWFRGSTVLRDGDGDGFLALVKPGDVRKLANEVRGNNDKLPEGDFSDLPERSLEALLFSIKGAGFVGLGTKYVAIIGDTGCEPDPNGVNAIVKGKGPTPKLTEQGKQKCIEELAAAIKQKDITIFFVHVGARKNKAEKLFKEDFFQLKNALPDELNGKVQYLTAEEQTLGEELARAQALAEENQRGRERNIERMESRNQSTEPGPKLLKRLKPVLVGEENSGESTAVDKFNNSYLQYFVPARAWLYHPSLVNGKQGGGPQFEELLFLASAERQALLPLLEHCRKELAKNTPFEGRDAVRVFAQELAAIAGGQGQDLEAEVLRSWDAIPDSQKELGVFLEDILGLRVKATLPFPPDGYLEAVELDGEAEIEVDPHETHEFWKAFLRVDGLEQAIRQSAGNAFWYQSQSLVP